MTPIVLLILVGMWAAVLLPPYLRDRNDTKAAGPQSPVSNKLNALSRSFGHRDRSGYVPVASASLGSPQQAGSPLPAGSRQPLTHRGAPQMVPSSPEPQSSAFSILGPPGSAVEAQVVESEDARFLLAPETPGAVEVPMANEAAAVQRTIPPRSSLPERPASGAVRCSTPSWRPAASACSWPWAWGVRSWRCTC